MVFINLISLTGSRGQSFSGSLQRLGKVFDSGEWVNSFPFSVLIMAAGALKKRTSSSAIAERSRCRVRELWLKVEDSNWESIFYGHYRSVFNHCDVIGKQSNRIRRKKRKIRAITPLKVIQGHQGRYQSKAHMRLPISDK